MIKCANKNDFDDIKKLWLECFDDDPGFVEWNFKNNYSPNNAFAAEVDGRVVSAMQSIPFELSVKKQKFKAEGIWGVSTHPKFRGQGYVRSLFEYSLPKVYSRDCEISVLVAAVSGVYEKFGYVDVCDYVTYSVESIDGILYDKVDDKTINELMHAYDKATKSKDIYINRDTEYLQKTLDALTKTANGKVFKTNDGYIMAYPHGTKYHTSEVCGSLNNLSVFKKMPVMARIVNVDSTIRKLAPYFKDGTNISIKDDIIPQNNIAFEIRNGCAFKSENREDTIDISEFTRTVFNLSESVQNIYLGFPLEI